MTLTIVFIIIIILGQFPLHHNTAKHLSACELVEILHVISIMRASMMAIGYMPIMQCLS